MAPLTVKQLKELKNKKPGKGRNTGPAPQSATTAGQPEPIDVDDVSTTRSDQVRAKRPRADEAEVDSANAVPENSDGFHAPPPKPLPEPEECRTVLQTVTGKGTLTTIWDNHFAFPELIDSFLISSEDESKIRSLGLIGACRAMEAYNCYAAAIARSVETQFGHAIVEHKKMEGELL